MMKAVALDWVFGHQPRSADPPEGVPPHRTSCRCYFRSKSSQRAYQAHGRVRAFCPSPVVLAALVGLQVPGSVKWPVAHGKGPGIIGRAFHQALASGERIDQALALEHREGRSRCSNTERRPAKNRTRQSSATHASTRACAASGAAVVNLLERARRCGARV